MSRSLQGPLQINNSAEIDMGISSLGSSSLIKLYSRMQSGTANSSDKADAAASKQAASQLLSISNSVDATLDSLLSGSDSKKDADKKDPLLDALNSSSPASAQAMLASLKTSNGYGQLLQSMLSGTSTDSGSSIFDSLGDSGAISSNSIYNSNTALMSALRKSGMSTEQVGNIYQKVTGAAAGTAAIEA